MERYCLSTRRRSFEVAAGTLLTEFLDLGATFAIVFFGISFFGSLKNQAKQHRSAEKTSGDAELSGEQATGDVPDTRRQASWQPLAMP